MSRHPSLPARIVSLTPFSRRATGILTASVSLLVALALSCSLAGAAVSGSSKGKISSARLSKKSFTTAQASSVTLTYKFSKKSKTFSYVLTFKKGSKWQQVKAVKKKGSFKGTHKTTVKKVFAGKAVKVGSYKLKLSADKGVKTLSFKVVKGPSGSSGGSTTTPTSTTPTGSAPSNTSLPAITGTTTQGQTLTASNGSWANSPTSYAYQWKRCDSSGSSCSDISSATFTTYLLQASDVSHTLRVSVTASNDYGSSSATSSQTALVQSPPPAPANTSLPTITGTATQGDVLHSDSGTWDNSPYSYSYQWLRCDVSGGSCSAISGATGDRRTLLSADVGHTIRLDVTATNNWGESTARSVQTEVVAAAPPETVTPSGWTWQSPLPQGNGLSALDFVDSSDGWAVGGYGTVVYTTNGGSKWNVSDKVTSENLEGVDFVDSTHGWAVGGDGTILFSGNGSDWTKEDSESAANLDSVSFADSLHGWAVGEDPDTGAGVVLVTSNGGTKWSQQYSRVDFTLTKVHFFDSSHGWVLGNSDSSAIILKTTDGGAHWSEIASGTSYNDSWREPGDHADFYDADHGWLILDPGGYSVVLSTTDGGAHWGQVYTTLTGGCQPNSDTNACAELTGDLQFVSPTKGWVVNATTSDGGAHWAFQAIGSPQYMTAIRFIDADHGWAVGSNGAIMTTSNGGSEWSEQSKGTKYEFDDVAFADLNSGWAVGSYSDYSSDSQRAIIPVILGTSDGGADWSEQFTPTGGTCDSFTSVFSVDSKHAWAVCRDEYDYHGILYATSDGSNWSQIYSGDYQIEQVKFTDAINGWAIAWKPGDQTNEYTDTYYIIATNNGGRDWSKVYQGANTSAFRDSFYGIDVTDSNHVWAIGSHSWSDGYGDWFYGAMVTYTSNGGVTWNTTGLNGYSGIAIDFIDNLHGWAVTDTGVGCETSDGGGTWDCGDFGFPGGVDYAEFDVDAFSDVTFVNLNDGWFVGGAGIYATTDGGASWHNQGEGGQGITFVDPNHGWAVGGDEILATTTGGFPPP